MFVFVSIKNQVWKMKNTTILRDIHFIEHKLECPSHIYNFLKFDEFHECLSSKEEDLIFTT